MPLVHIIHQKKKKVQKTTSHWASENELTKKKNLFSVPYAILIENHGWYSTGGGVSQLFHNTFFTHHIVEKKVVKPPLYIT